MTKRVAMATKWLLKDGDDDGGFLESPEDAIGVSLQRLLYYDCVLSFSLMHLFVSRILEYVIMTGTYKIMLA